VRINRYGNGQTPTTEETEVHIANMNTRNILAIGKTVWESAMTDADLAFVKAYPDNFTRDPKGFWFNTNLANHRDQAFRASRWTDVKPHGAS